MKKIPILKPFMPPNLMGKIKKTLYSGWVGEDPKVKLFEKKLKNYLNCKYVIVVNSGTSALWLACHLANLKPKEEVISTPMTCSATNIPFLHFGCKIIWADIDKETGNISPKDIEKKITEKTKAICIVNYAGRPCKIEEIKKIARKHSIKIIEDASQSLGAEYNGRKIGYHTDYVCFSLQAVKTITSVDGGILCMRTKKDYERAKKLRWFGIDREKKFKQKNNWQYKINEEGYKFQLNDVLSTIGIEQLKYLNKLITIQRSNAKYYSKTFKNLKNIKILKESKNVKSSN